MTKNKTSIQKVNRAVFRKTVVTGFCGGVLWSIIWLIMHYFKMVKISPTLIWEKLFSGWIEFDRWYMYLLLILLYGIFSIFLAILYFLCFKTIGHWAMGAGYGLIIWIIAVFIIPMMFYDINIFMEHPIETYIGFACLCFLYGLFIGYTISFDYENLHYEFVDQHR